MRNMIDLSGAFGEADDGFVINVHRTLAAIQFESDRRDRKNVKRRGARLAFAIAAICVLLAGTALALTNTWGILDFLSGRSNDAAVLPEAAGIIQTDVAQSGGQTDYAAFTVRQAVFDGQNVYLVVAVKPSDSGYLLLGPDANPSDPIGNLGPLFADKAGTIADFARESNKELIHTAVTLEGTNQSMDFLLEDDDTLVYMIKARLSDAGEKLDLKLHCAAARYSEKAGQDVPDASSFVRATLSVTIENTGAQKTLNSTEPADYSDCGVLVDKVTLTGSPMAIYAEIAFTVTDKEKFEKTDGGLWFEFLDAQGQRLPYGADTGGVIEQIDDEHFVQKSSLQAAEVLPGEIILRGFNCWEKNRYETHTFEMK